MKRSGRELQITCQVGESLVAAELGRQGFICTTFSHNVPDFDVLAIDETLGHKIPLQVKAIKKAGGFQSTADKWMHVDFDKVTKKQSLRRMEVANRDLIFVLVEVGERYGEDRFFLMTKAQLAEAYYISHSKWLEAHGWIRPRKSESKHCSIQADELPKEFENNWGILRGQ